MSDRPRTYKTDEEVAVLIREAAESTTPLRIEVDQKVYELRVRELREGADIWADYDPDAARVAWEESFGILKGVDVQSLVERIRDERSQETSNSSWPFS